MISMISRTGFAITAVLVGFAVQHAAAAEFPNLVGEWKGKTSPVHVGSTGHAVPKGEGVNFTDEFDITFKIENQKGNDIAGVVTTKNRNEPFIGSIRDDKTEGVMVDEDGHYEFKIVDVNTIDLCYWHITAESRVTTCFALKRAQ
jgi:hypothetical protein